MLPNFIASCSFFGGDTNTVLNFEWYRVILKVIFKVRKVQFGTLWSIWANISETLQAMTNVSTKHIYEVIYDLSVYFMTLTLYYIERSNKCHRTFRMLYVINSVSYHQILHEKHMVCNIWHFSLPYNIWPWSDQGYRPFNGLYLINGSSIDQSLYETHIVNHMAFHLALWQLTLGDIERTNQGNWFFSELYLINHACYDLSLYETHIYEVIYDLSIYIMTFDLGWPFKVKSRSNNFQWVVSHKWCFLWSKIVWNTYSTGKSYMAF